MKKTSQLQQRSVSGADSGDYFPMTWRRPEIINQNAVFEKKEVWEPEELTPGEINALVSKLRRIKKVTHKVFSAEEARHYLKDLPRK